MTKFNTSTQSSKLTTKAVNKSAITFLTAQNVTLSYTSAPLFQGLTFTVQRGDKIGLIGHNGCGKSSLLKLLNGYNQAYNAYNGNHQDSYLQHDPNSHDVHTGTVSKASNCLI